MIKTLYKKFQNWSEKGSIYIISDCHFCDLDMNWRINYINDIGNLNIGVFSEEQKAVFIANYLISSLNDICHKNDCLIVLGDVGDINWVKQLKVGYKVLIKGNHDVGSENYQRNPVEIKCYEKTCIGLDTRKCQTCDNCIEFISDNNLFDEVYEGPLFISEKILLSHEPILGNWLNLHGHTHDLDYECKNNELNLCCEKINFTPVNLNNIIKSGILKNIDSIHRDTINRATAKKYKLNN